ncbi:carboxyl-terminal protease family protein [Campylobacter sputorum aubsp. sputorum RM3237]|uniref:S41 family peptidase n=1 Tax=Campylobacter sputorum TaxID=206 RepID=UPI001F3B022A|nr:S41 family peptidase [Campylobacter sputorum]ASM34895.1 carboxyl-terminal protease family protein [Campylobacter sputorum aubsp. sputorum RM3237]QEL05086.1 carboxyl-terminal protease family protein [Campylobacter sputorum subsp. sputorum]
MKFSKDGLRLSLVGAIVFFVLCITELFAKEDSVIIKNTESLAKMTKVMSIVENYYVDDLNLSDIIDKSISGLLSNLDAHSGYLDEKSYKDMQVQTSGEFGGLGITVGMKDGALTVIAPIDDTPAYKAGVKAGDVILMIDGNSTINTNLEEAVKKMRGEPKTDITLTLVRKGEPKPIEVKITRDIIKVDSVKAKMIEDENILYIRVSNFDQNVEKKVVEAVKKYPKVKGIVLDLRNNPGGLLDQAVNLTNVFVKDGVIVSQKGRNSNENVIFNAKASKKITDTPLAVLVNGGSASASEIVSGSLQDHKRAIIIGENTFGKSSVQMVMPLGKSEAIRLTIARYYLPSGRTIQAVGVKPDLVVYPGAVPRKEFDFNIKESDLKQHLQSELEKVEKSDKTDNKTEEDKKDMITKTQVMEDIQLKTAIDTIKIQNIQINH